jgi:ATP-dependent exoDNAse (exonuclease V) alpha subunit
MAIYHFSMRMITRSQGGNAVGAAAHNAGERLTDSTGKVYDFSRKEHVVYAEILLPAGAPMAWQDRSVLWNEVERIEDRNSRYETAQLARDIDMALPRELPGDARIALVREFALAEFVALGMVVDLGIHEPPAQDGLFQPHAHLLLTLRGVTETGFGHKVRAWNRRALLQAWRERWGAHVNALLERAGVPERIDHRSFRERGIVDRDPMPKIGRAA